MNNVGRVLVSVAAVALLGGCSSSDDGGSASPAESAKAATGDGGTFAVEEGFIDPCQVPEDVLNELGVGRFLDIPMSGQDADRERGCMGIRAGASIDAPQGASIWFLSWAADVSFMEHRWSDEAEPIADLPNWRRISYAEANDSNLGCMLLYKSSTDGYFGIADAFADADDCSAVSYTHLTLPTSRLV